MTSMNSRAQHGGDFAGSRRTITAFVKTAAVLAALAAFQPQASAADKDRQNVTGTVVKAADGTPVAGATVYLLTRTVALPHPSVQTRSDAAGRFTFEGVLPGSYRLFAESGNQISSRQWGASSTAQSLRLKAEQVTVSSNEVPRPMTLRLVEGCRFRVSVKRAADNRPIANAKIRFPWGEIDRHYDTDSNGVVMIEGIRSEELVFQVRADGYALGEKRLEATQPGTTTDLSFSLGPGGAVEGTVHDVDGRPLFNVRVGATAKRTPAELHIGNSKTDGKGRFKIENVPTGETIELSIYQRGYVPKRQSFTLKASYFRGSVVSESRLRRKPKCLPSRCRQNFSTNAAMPSDATWNCGGQSCRSRRARTWPCSWIGARILAPT